MSDRSYFLYAFVAAILLVFFMAVFPPLGGNPGTPNNSSSNIPRSEEKVNTQTDYDTETREEKAISATNATRNRSEVTPTQNNYNLSSEGVPTEQRYATEYLRNSSPEWIPEQKISPRGSNAIAYEVTRYPNAEPTRHHLQAAWELYNRSYEAAQENGWFDFENATEDGYRSYDPFHYINQKRYLSNETLNPQKPEALIYFSDSGSPSPNETDDTFLAGYAYIAGSLTEPGEQVAGPLTTWHYHPNPTDSKRCHAGRLGMVKGFEANCTQGSVKLHRSPEMLHVWFIDHPEGPFGTSMISYEWAQKKAEEIDEKGGVPGKMSREEFKSILKRKYSRHFVAD
jgi:hypothetical protein